MEAGCRLTWVSQHPDVPSVTWLGRKWLYVWQTAAPVRTFSRSVLATHA